jgi:hypothetical protein
VKCPEDLLGPTGEPGRTAQGVRVRSGQCLRMLTRRSAGRKWCRVAALVTLLIFLLFLLVRRGRLWQVLATVTGERLGQSQELLDLRVQSHHRIARIEQRAQHPVAPGHRPFRDVEQEANGIEPPTSTSVRATCATSPRASRGCVRRSSASTMR